jgi:predicted Rossmann fold nucleotide-binding protein DprA/Smf involved in DNA uptake
MERECLNILLRRTCAVAVCPARSLPKRIPAEFKKPIDDGRLLLISAFDEKHSRTTAETSAYRNRIVAAISDVVFVPYAAEGGKTEALCKEIVQQGRSVFTLLGEQTDNLARIGVRQVTVHDVVSVMMG